MTKFSDKSTTTLRCMRESIDFELSQRKDEPTAPIIRVCGGEIGDLTAQQFADPFNQKLLLEDITTALRENNRIFNLKLMMVPLSDQKALED
jgi:hypothetical protein